MWGGGREAGEQDRQLPRPASEAAGCILDPLVLSKFKAAGRRKETDD